MLAGRVSLRLLLVACFVSLGSPASAVTVDWVTVGDPGNAADTTGFGSVAQVYRISDTEVTNAQYAEFLDAVAGTDTNGLYNVNMSSSPHGGITQSGLAGSFDYDVKAGFAQKPVNFVSFYDSLRFANWLHNGQLGGAQDGTTTEAGAYTITAQGISDNTITRNAGATIFLTNEDEWYKAAYYDAGSTGYFDYPVGSDLETLCTALAALPNAANCDSAVGTVTDAGSYTLAPSPAGTFDQAGNVFEWNEAIISGSVRGLRGGSWFSDPADQAASFRPSGDPTVEISNLGFRVASVPEPGTGLLVVAGMLGLAARRRRRIGVATFLVAATLASSATGEVCRDVTVPVALAQGQAVDQQIFGRLCEPGAGAALSSTLLVLVHGITYDHHYWDFPDPTGGTDRYSFVSAALDAGFSTLSIDRIGAGSSSHPLSALVTIDSNAHTVHQVIQAVRNGAITGGGGEAFDTVVLVGHSYGSWTTWFEATRYNDIDAVVLTGATHGLTTVDAPFIVIPGLYPALADPRFGPLSGLDPGYQTTQPGKRYKAFYAPGPVDPAVVQYDELTKGTVTSAELQNYQLILAEPLDIRVPVVLTVGAADTLFCGPALGGAPCTSEQALIAFEAPFLGPNVPSIDAYILPAGGHDMNQMLNSQLYFQGVLDKVEALANGLP